MKRMSILTVSLVALCGLLIAPVQAATTLATDTPDILLAPGTTGDDVFDLNDFFEPNAASYSAIGGSVSGSMASVLGAAAPGMMEAVFTGDGVEATSMVQVTDFMIGNGPAIDNNNRLAGVAGGNMFVNGIVPGTSVASMMALGLPEVGGGGTPGGVTGGAALIATIGQVTVSTAANGLIQRDSSVVASGAGSAASGGLTATLNADGSYSLAAGANFAGAWVVTFGAQAGASAAGVHMLAAAANMVALEAAGWIVQPAGSEPAATLNFAGGTLVVSAAAGTGNLLISSTPVTVGEYAIVSIDYSSNSAGVNVAAVAFDGALGPDTVAYTNPGGANIDGSGAMKNIALSVKSVAGAISPAFQVFNGGASAATVTIHSVKVIHARPLPDYALNVNAKAANFGFADLTGWNGDVLGTGAGGPTASTSNNFASDTPGAMALAGAGAFANAGTMVTVGVGTVVGQCYVMRTSDAEAGSAFAFVLTDGVTNNLSTFVPGAAIPTDGWLKVICSGTQSVGMTAFFVAQCAGFDGVVDDASVRIITDQDSYFDSVLLGA